MSLVGYLRDYRAGGLPTEGRQVDFLESDLCSNKNRWPSTTLVVLFLRVGLDWGGLLGRPQELRFSWWWLVWALTFPKATTFPAKDRWCGGPQTCRGKRSRAPRLRGPSQRSSAPSDWAALNQTHQGQSVLSFWWAACPRWRVVGLGGGQG